MSNITMTNVDPGENTPLAADEYVAVYGQKTLLDTFYPVGSYYETSDTQFDPNVEWGGVWEEDSGGRVTVSRAETGTFSVVGSTGGEEGNVLTNNNIPWGLISVGHIATMEGEFYGGGIITKGRGAGLYQEGSVSALSMITYSHTYEFGKATPDRVSTLQPYVVVKRWHRTA